MSVEFGSDSLCQIGRVRGDFYCCDNDLSCIDLNQFCLCVEEISHYKLGFVGVSR